MPGEARRYALKETGPLRSPDEIEIDLESLAAQLLAVFGSDIVSIDVDVFRVDVRPETHWIEIVFEVGARPWQGERTDVRAVFRTAKFEIDWAVTSNPETGDDPDGLS